MRSRSSSAVRERPARVWVQHVLALAMGALLCLLWLRTILVVVTTLGVAPRHVQAGQAIVGVGAAAIP